jgi:hypothetical protein
MKATRKGSMCLYSRLWTEMPSNVLYFLFAGTLIAEITVGKLDDNFVTS